jgi:hypothetical protein
VYIERVPGLELMQLVNRAPFPAACAAERVFF